jgi:DNA replicative helicase MCM subunit Mcm2 (Cdc46/Mcm family)
MFAAEMKKTIVPRNSRVQAHLVGHRPFTAIRSLKSQVIGACDEEMGAQTRALTRARVGKFVSIRGTVVRVSGVRPLVRRIDFECSKCNDIAVLELRDGKFAAVAKCKQCKTKTMEARRTLAETVDWQKIRFVSVGVRQRCDNAMCRLQEIIDNKSSGRVPRAVECELTGQLVDRCVPGGTSLLLGGACDHRCWHRADIVVVSGIVKMITAEVNEKAGKVYALCDVAVTRGARKVVATTRTTVST